MDWSDPFTYHCTLGAVPPLVTLEVKVAGFPPQTVVVAVDIDTDVVELGVMARVKVALPVHPDPVPTTV